MPGRSNGTDSQADNAGLVKFGCQAASMPVEVWVSSPEPALAQSYDSRNPSSPSVTAGQPPRSGCLVHVHAKTALTEPVRHQVRQLSDSGEGSEDDSARS